MKRLLSAFFWIFSGALALMALALLSGSALTAALLLGCAVLINPLFQEKVPLKKGWTALLAIGLFITAVAVYPSEENASVTQQPEQVISAKEAPKATPATRTLQVVPLESQEPEQTEVAAASPTEKITPSPKPTASPTKEPTPEPTATLKPTESPTQKPTQTPEPPTKAVPATRSVGIMILDYSDTVSRGEYAFIKIQGAPNTEYDCEVEYKTTMSNASGLGTKRSDSDGIVSWRWKVGTRTSLDYMPTIYIEGGGESTSVQFEVIK